MSSSPCAVTFIGTGIMGSPMAEHLITNGHPLHVHNRTREKAKLLLEQGAYGTIHLSPQQLPVIQ